MSAANVQLAGKGNLVLHLTFIARVLIEIFVTVIIESPSGWSWLALFCPRRCFAGVLFAQTLDFESPSGEIL